MGEYASRHQSVNSDTVACDLWLCSSLIVAWLKSCSSHEFDYNFLLLFYLSFQFLLSRLTLTVVVKKKLSVLTRNSFPLKTWSEEAENMYRVPIELQKPESKFGRMPEKYCGNMSRQVSVSTAFSSSPKLSRIDSNTENMFSFFFQKVPRRRKENNLFSLIIKW